MQIIRLAIAFLMGAAIFYSIEAMAPAVKSKPIWRKDSFLDLGYWFFTSTVTRFVSSTGAVAVIAVTAWILGRKLSPELAAGTAPINMQPQWLIILELLVFGDFIGYWTHRFFHGRRLWKLHAIHHSSVELDWLSAVRLHPVDELLEKSMRVVPLVVLGFPLQILAAYVPFLTVYAILLHANVNWSFGFLRYVITTPLFHRWHHTSEQEGLDKNFAGLFPFWDMIFGTFYMPEGLTPTVFGVKGAKVPHTMVGQLMYPFKRRQARIRAAAS